MGQEWHEGVGGLSIGTHLINKSLQMAGVALNIPWKLVVCLLKSLYKCRLKNFL